MRSPASESENDFILAEPKADGSLRIYARGGYHAVGLGYLMMLNQGKNCVIFELVKVNDNELSEFMEAGLHTLQELQAKKPEVGNAD